MRSLADEFKQLLVTRIQIASGAEIMSVAGALCGNKPAIAQWLQPVTCPADDRVDVPRFTLLGDESVLDNKTDLVWSRGNVGEGRLNWKDAKDAAGACRLDGMTDWRLPNIQELLSIVDYSRSDPAIDPLFHCEKAFYWSATPYAGAPADYAWIVFFSSGYAYYDFQGNSYFVRAVRPRQ